MCALARGEPAGSANGQNLAAELGLCRQLYRLEHSIVLFKKNDPKPENAHGTPFLSLSVSPAANAVSARSTTTPLIFSGGACLFSMRSWYALLHVSQA